jgi:Protein of unknown function (DUF3485)
MADATTDEASAALNASRGVERRFRRAPDRGHQTDQAAVGVSEGRGSVLPPQSCLPGAGWRPVVSGRTEIDAGGRMIPVNRFVIQKGIDKLELYPFDARQSGQVEAD